MKKIKVLICLNVCLACLICYLCLNICFPENPITQTNVSPITFDVNRLNSTTSGSVNDPQNIDFRMSVLNPLSPAYAMKYIEKYGYPTEPEKLLNYHEVYSDWRPFLPNLMSSITKRMIMKTTDDIITKTASISVNTSKFAVGEELVATLTSLDGTGRRKKFGGDFYRARLIRGSNKLPDAIPCRIIDNNDGTYTIKAPLLFEGNLTLDVMLVTPLEGILEMIKETEKMLCNDRGYTATLQSKEQVVCSASYDW